MTVQGMTQEQILIGDLTVAKRYQTPLWGSWLRYAQALANLALDLSEPTDDGSEYEPGDHQLAYCAARLLSTVAYAYQGHESAPRDLVALSRNLQDLVIPYVADADDLPSEPRR